MEMVAHDGKSKDIHAVQDLQSLDQVQKIGLVHVMDGQASQSSPRNHMIYRALGVTDKSGYAGHRTPPGVVGW
jgi:hypothetical protein